MMKKQKDTPRRWHPPCSWYIACQTRKKAAISIITADCKHSRDSRVCDGDAKIQFEPLCVKDSSAAFAVARCAEKSP